MQRGNGLWRRLLSGACAGALLGGAPALAQTADDSEDQVGIENGQERAADDNVPSIRTREVILVTAQKREEAILDVPINITAYDGAFLQDIGVTEFDELARFVPGLVVQEQSVNNPGFVIRGITSDSGASNIEPRVSVFQDGVSISRSRGSIVQLFDLDRVEVLKGPQGTLFGRSAQIGAISVHSKRPDYERGAFVSYEFGNLSQDEVEAWVNIPIIEDKLAVRVAGNYTFRNGFIDNNTGVALNGTQTVATRGSIRWQPTSKLTVDVIASYQHDTPPGSSFKSGVIPALGGTTDPNEFASLNTFGGFLGGQPLSVDREVWGVTTQVEYEISPAWTFTNIAAYRQFDSVEIFDPDGTAFDVLIFAEDAFGQQWSEELRFNFDRGGRFRGFFGGNVFFENGDQQVPLGFDERALLALFSSVSATGASPDLAAALGLPADATFLFGDPGLTSIFLSGDPAQLEPIVTGVPPFNALSPFFVEQFTNFAENNAFDVFAELTVEVFDGLELTGGIRWTLDDRTTGFSGGAVEGVSALAAAGILTGGTPIINPLDGEPVETILAADTGNTVIESDEENFTDFVWRAVANYAVNPNLNLYASYSRGRRPNIIEVDVAGPVFLGFEELPDETVDSYEIGAKGLFFNGRLEASGSVFFYDYRDFITTIVDATTGLTETINAGNADSIGFESQFFATPTDGLDLFITYGYNRSRFDDTDDEGNPLVFGGNRFRLSPDHTVSAGLTYVHQLDDWGSLFVTPTYTWQSLVFFEDENQTAVPVFDPMTGDLVFTVPSVSQQSFGLFNIRTGYTTPDERVQLTFEVANVLDTDYIIDGGNTGGAFGIPTFIAGPPRFYSARIALTF